MEPKLKSNEEFAEWFEQWLAKIQRNRVWTEREYQRGERQARTDSQELGQGNP